MSDTETKIRYFPVTNIFWSTFICKAVKYVHVRVYESNTYTYYRQLFDEWESSTYWNSIRQIQKSRLRNAQIWVDFWKRDDNQKVVTSDVFYMQLNI